MRTDVIDLALGQDGEPLVVELNGLHNAGLYATNPRLVASALAEARAASVRVLAR